MSMSTNDIYRPEVIDYVTQSVRFCLLLEKIGEKEKRDFEKECLVLLPMVYVGAERLLALMEDEQADEIMHFVSEDDYNYVAEGVRTLLGESDAYLEVFMDEMKFSDTPITCFLSENMADIYQELKDMAANFQTENESVMAQAVAYSLLGFREHWGQKLLNAMRALHADYFA